MTADTKPNLYIIESLEFEDEFCNRLEGKILRDILALSGKRTEYIYIRTKKELKTALKQFYATQNRYLHISCHGNPKSVCLTLDEIGLEEFCELARPKLSNRRLFFSACEVVNEELASILLPDSDCYSLIGPRDKIDFDDAVLMWASFYHLMFRDDTDAMKGGKIRWALRRIRGAFGIEFDYYRPKGKAFTKVDIEEK